MWQPDPVSNETSSDLLAGDVQRGPGDVEGGGVVGHRVHPRRLHLGHTLGGEHLLRGLRNGTLTTNVDCLNLNLRQISSL